MLDFFAGGTARIQALLIGALAIFAIAASLLVYGLWWRAQAFQARAERDVAVAQGDVLAGSVKACSASVDLAHEAAAQAVDQGKALLAEARRLSAGGLNQVKRLEELLAKSPPPGADCRDAWREIEQISRKAGAAP